MRNKKPLTLYELACRGDFDHIREKIYKKKDDVTSTNTKKNKKL
jgi:hypothetical protein